MAYIDISKKENRIIIHQKYGGRCSYCGHLITIKELCVDHLIPLRRKMNNCVHGDNEIDNLLPACQSCNYSKSSMDLEKWRIELTKKLDRLHRDSSTYRLCKRFGFIQEIFPEPVFYFERFTNG